MEIKKFEIEGPLLVKNKCFTDDRGFFTERYKAKDFQELGLPLFVQDNFSVSAPWVLRGLHYQWERPQGKLVTCTQGQILDVIVDIRAKSPTFGQHISVALKASEPTWFWVPPGFAHGFAVTGDSDAAVLYKVDQYWNGSGEGAIRWNDTDLKIQWQDLMSVSSGMAVESWSPRLTAKDDAAPSFAEYRKSPKF